MEADQQRRRSLVEGIMVIISKVTDLMRLSAGKLPAVVRRSFDGHTAGFFCHLHCFKVRLNLHIAAPHFKLAHKCLEVGLIVGGNLYAQVLTARERSIDLIRVAHAQNTDILARHLRNHAESFHGAHCRSDLTGSPQILSLHCLQEIFCHIVGGLAKAVNVRPEDGASDKVTLKLTGKEIRDLHNAVLVSGVHLHFRDHIRIEARGCLLPAPLTGRIDEQYARIHICRDLCKSAFIGKPDCLLHSALFLFKHQKQRCPEGVVIHLSVDLCRRYISL